MFFSVRILNTLSAENSQMIGAIEVLYSILMFAAKFLLQSVFVLIIEIDLGQDRILFNYFKEDINVQGETLYTFQVLNQFATYWTSYSKVMMKTT